MKIFAGAALGFIVGIFVEAAAQYHRRNQPETVRTGDPLEGED